MNGEDLAAIEEKWLQQCGPCDGGLPISCTHPTEDCRPVISDLLAALRERDNSTERVQTELASFEKAWIPDRPNTVVAYRLLAAIRAALDIKETT